MTLNFRPLFSGPKTVQASVTLLEQLPIFIDKSGTGILHQDILPMLYLALESSMAQVGKVEDIRLYSGRTEHFWGGPTPILMKLSGMVSYMEKMIKKPFGNCFGH